MEVIEKGRSPQEWSRVIRCVCTAKLKITASDLYINELYHVGFGQEPAVYVVCPECRKELSVSGVPPYVVAGVIYPHKKKVIWAI